MAYNANGDFICRPGEWFDYFKALVEKTRAQEDEGKSAKQAAHNAEIKLNNVAQALREQVVEDFDLFADVMFAEAGIK